MTPIKKPTVAIITGHKDKQEGQLILADGWTSNGAWLIKNECLKAPARASKKVTTGSIFSLSLLNSARRDSSSPCYLTEERTEYTQRRSFHEHGSKKVDSFTLAKFTSDEGNAVWANLLYVEWIADLGPIKWFCGRDYRDPIRIENEIGETVALIMPVRP
jgi:hypothetical protein